MKQIAQVCETSTLFLHGVCMLRECMWWVCTQAARKENPNPNPNSHDHCLFSKWKYRACVHTHPCNWIKAV